MPLSSKEQMQYRILELEMYIALMHEMPREEALLRAFIPVLENAVGRLKNCYLEWLRVDWTD